jgi:hypothetical protein
MADRGAMSDGPATPNGSTHVDPPGETAAALEQRVRRLEDAVALIQDTRQMEERVVERVSVRLRRESAPALKESAGLLVNAGRQLLPAALTMIRTETAKAEPPVEASSGGGPRSWLVFDAYREARAMVRMFFDRRYRMSLPARVAPPMLFAAILTSWIWLPGTSLLPSLLATPLVKTVDVLLAFFAFKILSREARRYREVLSDRTPLSPP